MCTKEVTEAECVLAVVCAVCVCSCLHNAAEGGELNQ